jgi:hypothetical protein
MIKVFGVFYDNGQDDSRCDIIFKFWNKFLKSSLESDTGMSFSPVSSSC